MPKARPKRKIVGYGAWINRTGERGGWERVGFLFDLRGEAESYIRHAVRGTFTASKVEAIRSNVSQFAPPTRDSQDAA